MKKIIFLAMMATLMYGNQPVCSASEYAKRICQTVYINGTSVQECRWTCLPLAGAGR